MLPRMLDSRGLILSVALAGAIAVVACGGSGGTKATTPPSAGGSATSLAVVSAAARPATAAAAAQASPTIRNTDPCSYVTVAEVQTATGKTVTGGAVRVNDFSCRYQTSDGGVINTGVASPVEKSRFDSQVRSNAGSATAEMISGLGDEAFAVPFGVSVWKSPGVSISVEVSPSASPTGGDAAIALARLLVQRS